MDGFSFAVLSAVFFSLTVIFDKLAVTGDCYNNDATLPWFVSSLLGSILGVTVLIIWSLLNEINESMWSQSLAFASTTYTWNGLNVSSAFLVFIGGLGATLTLRSYFRCFEQLSASLISLVVAASPIVVYATSIIFNGDRFGLLQLISVLITVSAIVGFEYLDTESEDGHKNLQWKDYKDLLILFVLGSVYVVFSDRGLAAGNGSVQFSLAALPFFWLGYSFGFFWNIFKPNVIGFLIEITSKTRFLIIIMMMELFGVGFTLFEFLGLGELSATLASLILAVHVVWVWLFDLYINRRHANTVKEAEEIRILFFVVPKKEIRLFSLREIFLQGTCVLLALVGIAMWPS